MKKFISALLLTVLLCLSFSSCRLDFDGFDVDAGEKSNATIYGVVTTVHDVNHTCLYFPSTGHVTMPRIKGGEKAPVHKYGDLIKITFGTSLNNIPIMESFPGQFGIEAEQVVVKEAAVGLSITEKSVYFTHAVPENTSVSVGELLTYTVTVDGQQKHIGRGEITEITEGRCTVDLSSDGSAEEFLKFIFEYELKISKE